MRPQDLADQLRPRGGEEQELGLGAHPLVVQAEEHLSDLIPDAGSARLPGEQHIVAGLAQVVGQQTGLGGLAAAVWPFNGEEDTQSRKILTRRWGSLPKEFETRLAWRAISCCSRRT